MLDRITDLGTRLQHARELAAISARELDRLSGITEGHTSLIESGAVRDVRSQTLAGFSRVLGVSIDWLVTGAGKTPTERVVKATVEVARAAYSGSKPAA